MMKAITVRQPSAWAILHARKNIENRSWRTHLRGTIAIHAAKGMTRSEYEAVISYFPLRWQWVVPAFEELPRSAIIGVVDLVDCVEESKSRWFGGPLGFVLKNPRPINPIPCIGGLGFWDLHPEIERKIRRMIKISS